VLGAVLAAAAEPRFPPLTGRVVDAANLLGTEDRRALEGDLQALEAKTTDQLVIYTAPSLQGYPIEDFGYRLGRAWGIGQKGKDNGVILIAAPNERKVRIEVGRGLEPQLTDAMTRLIIENAIIPAFRRNDFAGGIKAGVRDIRAVLLGDAAAVRQRAVARSPSGGMQPVTLLALVLGLALAVILVQSLLTAHPERVAADRRRRRAAPWPGSPWGGAGWGGSSGGWQGGDSGGGFSGGGGDFGGGGASGSW
jgi:uncharacterized protein